MGLDNVAVQWPRTDRRYEPVSPAEFADFAELVAAYPHLPGPAAALAGHIGKTGTVPATGYTELVDLMLGLNGVLYATDDDADDDDEDPVIDPDGCAWIAGGVERFVAGHRQLGEEVTFDSVGTLLRTVVSEARLGDHQLRWLEGRLDELRDPSGEAPRWSFTVTELAILGRFYRRCADRGFAVYADY